MEDYQYRPLRIKEVGLKLIPGFGKPAAKAEMHVTTKNDKEYTTVLDGPSMTTSRPCSDLKDLAHNLTRVSLLYFFCKPVSDRIQCKIEFREEEGSIGTVICDDIKGLPWPDWP